MTLLHDAYVALLSGITTLDEKGHIKWVRSGHKVTVEPVDVEAGSYVVRYYDRSGRLWMQTHCLNDQPHGKRIIWHDNGQISMECNYHHGQLHGNYKSWREDGSVKWDVDYFNGYYHGREVHYSKNGDTTFERYYINCEEITKSEWEQHNE